MCFKQNFHLQACSNKYSQLKKKYVESLWEKINLVLFLLSIRLKDQMGQAGQVTEHKYWLTKLL